MKPVCLAAAPVVLIVLIAGCAATSSPASRQSAQPVSSSNGTYILHTIDNATPGDATTKPPRLTVGVSNPDTQLILPWFLNDIINFINYR